MKKFKYNILFFLLVIISCESPTEPTSLDEDYMPLIIGNKWYYSSNIKDTTTIDIIVEILNQEVIENKMYYKMMEQNISSSFVDTFSYYFRMNGDTLFSRLKLFPEEVIADFSLNKNEIAYWKEDLSVVEKTNDIIKYATLNSEDYEYNITFEKNVGIVNIVENSIIHYYRKLVKYELK
jgi:hypothetical protein